MISKFSSMWICNYLIEIKLWSAFQHLVTDLISLKISFYNFLGPRSKEVPFPSPQHLLQNITDRFFQPVLAPWNRFLIIPICLSIIHSFPPTTQNALTPKPTIFQQLLLSLKKINSPGPNQLIFAIGVHFHSTHLRGLSYLFHEHWLKHPS